MHQVPTQCIAKWVKRWSFVSMGEDGGGEADYMHCKREINYDYKIVLFFKNRNVQLLFAFTISQDK